MGDRSVTKIAGKYQTNHLSKTNRERVFPCGQRMIEFLTEIRTVADRSGYVFAAKQGPPINYDVFAGRVWPSVVGKVVPRKTTPYSCRDTFITRQVAAGKPPAVVAKWVDNSVKIIEAKYLDIRAINDIRPD